MIFLEGRKFSRFGLLKKKNPGFHLINLDFFSPNSNGESIKILLPAKGGGHKLLFRQGDSRFDFQKRGNVTM